MAGVTFKAGTHAIQKGRRTGDTEMVKKGKVFQNIGLQSGPKGLDLIQSYAPEEYKYYQAHDGAKATPNPQRIDNTLANPSARGGVGVKDTVQRKKRLTGGSRGGRTLLGGGGSTKTKLGL